MTRLRRVAKEAVLRLYVCAALILCGLGVLVAPEPIIRYLQREFEGL